MVKEAKGFLPDVLCRRCFFRLRAPGVGIDRRLLKSSEQPVTSLVVVATDNQRYGKFSEREQLRNWQLEPTRLSYKRQP